MICALLATPPFLCLRRGVSELDSHLPAKWDFSLPTQRCFQAGMIAVSGAKLFSAYAEVFLCPPTICGFEHPFLCLRRGVSLASATAWVTACFSLPTQRCFLADKAAALIDQLFSAYAEVFPADRSFRCFPGTFLCLRRGVSGESATRA